MKHIQHRDDLISYLKISKISSSQLEIVFGYIRAYFAKQINPNKNELIKYLYLSRKNIGLTTEELDSLADLINKYSWNKNETAR